MKLRPFLLLAFLVVSTASCAASLFESPTRLLIEVSYTSEWEIEVYHTSYYTTNQASYTEPGPDFDGTTQTETAQHGTSEFTFVLDDNWFYAKASKVEQSEDDIVMNFYLYDLQEDTRTLLITATNAVTGENTSFVQTNIFTPDYGL